MSTNTAAGVVDFNTAPSWVRLSLAAKLASVSTRTIRRWASCGFIVTSKPGGGVVLVQRDSLRSFIERGVRTTESAA